MIPNTKYKLIIGWLYPELMSTYGDRGNIIVLQKRCEWRRIKVKINRLDLGFKINDLRGCDLLFMGGAQDKQQQIVEKDLKEKRQVLKQMIENGIPGLYICGAYQFLGKYYKKADGTIIHGLNILDLHTENPGVNYSRLIGNVVVEVNSSWFMVNKESSKFTINYEPSTIRLVGFENHGGRTYLGKMVKPFGKVIHGFGNNGNLPAMQDGKALQAGDETEGAIYKNSFGTYLHGPILPKNPEFADLLIKLALKKKYNKNIGISPIDDSLENKTKENVLLKLKIKQY